MSTIAETLQRTKTERFLLTQEEVEVLKANTRGASYNLIWLCIIGIPGCFFYLLFKAFEARAILEIMAVFFLGRLILIILQYHRVYTDLIGEWVFLKRKSIFWTIFLYGGSVWFAWKYPDLLLLWSGLFIFEISHLGTNFEDVLREVSRRRKVRRIANASSVTKIVTTTTTAVCGKSHTPASELMLDAGPIKFFEQWELFLKDGSSHEVSEGAYHAINEGDEYSYSSTRYVFDNIFHY